MIYYSIVASIQFFAGSELHIWRLQYGHVLPGLPYQGTNDRKEDQLAAELEPFYVMGFAYYEWQCQYIFQIQHHANKIHHVQSSNFIDTIVIVNIQTVLSTK